jgi:hypothetical protein
LEKSLRESVAGRTAKAGERVAAHAEFASLSNAGGRLRATSAILHVAREQGAATPALAGWGARRLRRRIETMKPHVKSSQIFGWDAEPVDERPSEFCASTGYSVLTGDHTIAAPTRSRPPGRFGFKSLLAFCGVVLGLGAFALTKVALLLQHA